MFLCAKIERKGVAVWTNCDSKEIHIRKISNKIWIYTHFFVSLAPITANHRCIRTSIIHEVCGNHIVYCVLPVW